MLNFFQSKLANGIISDRSTNAVQKKYTPVDTQIGHWEEIKRPTRFSKTRWCCFFKRGFMVQSRFNRSFLVDGFVEGAHVKLARQCRMSYFIRFHGERIYKEVKERASPDTGPNHASMISMQHSHVAKPIDKIHIRFPHRTNPHQLDEPKWYHEVMAPVKP